VKLTRLENVLALFFALEIGLAFLVPVALTFGEGWTSWELPVVIALSVLAPVSFVKSLPYTRWLAVRLVRILHRLPF